MNQQEAAEGIIRTVELLAVNESEDNYDLDIFDSEYEISICCGCDDKIAIIVASKLNDMRIECISGEIKYAEEISEADTVYWQQKAVSLLSDLTKSIEKGV